MTIPFGSFDKSALSFFSYDITKKKFKMEFQNMWSPFFLKFLNFSCNFRELAVSNFLLHWPTESPWL